MIPRKLAGLALLAGIVGCDPDSTGPATSNTGVQNQTPPPAPQAPAQPVTGSVTPGQSLVVLLPGTSRIILVKVLDAGGQPISGRLVTWSSDDTSVVKVAATGNCGAGASPGCYRTSVYAISPGTAHVTALVDGLSQSITVEVPKVIAGPSGIAVSYQVIEFIPDVYAPLVNVTETAGALKVEIIAVLIAIPGIGGPTFGGWFCAGSVALGPYGSADLFHEIYGDYQLSISGGNRTSDIAQATVYVRRGDGAVVAQAVTGPVVQGGWPTTYTGGKPAVDWQCT